MTPLLMAILNVTPDSFSDGGRYPDANAAIAAARRMAADGAAIIDIGAESTRPGAVRVPPREEIARLLPVVGPLASAGLTLSIDTRNAGTMAACLDAGAAMINDVSGLRWDADSAPLVAARGCPVILMHMRGTPEDMQAHAVYGDVVAEVVRELAELRDAAELAGIQRDRILLDPGLGFAKTAAQNMRLMAHLSVFAALGSRLVVGASRKRFLGDGAATGPEERIGGSIAAAVLAAQAGAAILRVHDVAETAQALRLLAAVTGREDAGPLDGGVHG